MKSLLRPVAAAKILSAAALLSACQSSAPGPDQLALNAEEPALRAMEQISRAAQTCWFASGDAAFRPYRLADELNSYSGRPRILLVPANHPEARPLLVVQAEGEPARIDAFGPLMTDRLGARIAADVKRWAAGSPDCGGSA